MPSTSRPDAYNDATQATALDTAGNVNAADYEEYAYDPNGNRTTLRKRDGSTIAYSYDDLNRVTLKEIPPRTTGTQALTAAQTRDVHYGYDLRGLQTEARFDSLSGEGISSQYDGFGRLKSSASSVGGTTRTLTYQYDRNGNRTRITHPDGAQFDYSYDGLNRPAWLSDPSSALNHSYEPWGSVSGINRIGGASGRWTTPDGRLISLSHYNGPSFTLDTYWAFTHNPAGQIATQWGMSDAYAWTGHYGVQRPYTTNGLNQYSQSGSGAGRAEFTYDFNGNLVTETPPSPAPPRTYVYDIENRLVGAPGNVALVYDPLGRLYSVSSPTTDTRFLYDGDALVGEYDAAGTLLRRYVHDVGADVPVIQYEGTTVSATTRRYLLANAQGSIVARTDGSSVIQSRNTYDEYGIPGSANTGRFQYTGQIWIPELGMYHYKARIYSPTLGRFLQTDPVGYEDQYNLYAYVGNDPVNGTDPTGMKCEGTRAEGYNCHIDTERIPTRSGYIEIPVAANDTRFAAFNAQYTAAVNALAHQDQDRSVTVEAVRGGRAFDITVGQALNSLVNREFTFSRTELDIETVPTGSRIARRVPFAALTTRGLGRPNEPGQTYVSPMGLNAAPRDIVHDGIHSTPQERNGGLLRPGYPLGTPRYRHQRQYDTAACALLGTVC